MKLLFTSPVSACFELENDAPYYAPVHYTVSVSYTHLTLPTICSV